MRFRQKTRYVGGLVGSLAKTTRAAARERLLLDPDQEIIVTLSGGGGTGANLGSLTVGARAQPDALWLVVGVIQRQGHETDFGNLRCVGWVDNVPDYIAAADIVIAMPGDTVVHEIASVGRPLLCIPEWCYYGEQVRKAEALEHIGAAVSSLVWPSSFEMWRDLLERARRCDLDVQRSLTHPDAARNAADYISGIAERLWLGHAELARSMSQPPSTSQAR